MSGGDSLSDVARYQIHDVAVEVHPVGLGVSAIGSINDGELG